MPTFPSLTSTAHLGFLHTLEDRNDLQQPYHNRVDNRMRDDGSFMLQPQIYTANRGESEFLTSANNNNNNNNNTAAAAAAGFPQPPLLASPTVAQSNQVLISSHPFPSSSSSLFSSLAHFHPQQQQQQQASMAPFQPFASLSPAQLWMGDIDPWMNEEFVRQIWIRMGEHQVSVKMIRDRMTGAAANYCFIELPSQMDAERVLIRYNGHPMPAPLESRVFRLNWAGNINSAAFPSLPPLSTNNSHALTSAAPMPAANAASSSSLAVETEGAEFSLFVGDLASEVTDTQLASEFRSRYKSVRKANVVVDPITQQPRGYGFVRFGDDDDRQRALVETQGLVIGSRAIRVSTATPKRLSTATNDNPSPTPSDASSLDSNALYNPATDPHNTTVFVGGLASQVSEAELRSFFAVHGEVGYCKIPPNRGCGFVTFEKREAAENALKELNGHLLGGSRVRLSWGRSQSHAKHNYRNRTKHQRHQRQQKSRSQRNSISEQHLQQAAPRRTKSLVKPNEASNIQTPQPQSAFLAVSANDAGMGYHHHHHQQQQQQQQQQLPVMLPTPNSIYQHNTFPFDTPSRRCSVNQGTPPMLFDPSDSFLSKRLSSLTMLSEHPVVERLERRPSAGVIGQRRPSKNHQQPRKTASQVWDHLSMTPI